MVRLSTMTRRLVKHWDFGYANTANGWQIQYEQELIGRHGAYSLPGELSPDEYHCGNGTLVLAISMVLLRC